MQNLPEILNDHGFFILAPGKQSKFDVLYLISPAAKIPGDVSGSWLGPAGLRHFLEFYTNNILII